MTEEEQTPVAEGEHRPPVFKQRSYHCPHCGVLAPMVWRRLTYTGNNGYSTDSNAYRVECLVCEKEQVWVAEIYQPLMLLPQVGGGPRPHMAMPADVRPDYEEARAILQQSPRGACALLRLATQKLVDDLVPGGGNLDSKTGKLVQQGLPEPVAQALDVLRVVGNHAVHPGELRLDDDVEMASGLFECINILVEDRIARPSRIAVMFGKLPERAREAIEKRDRKALPPGEE